MWIIGAAVGLLMLVGARWVPQRGLRRGLRMVGAVLAAGCLLYGGLVALLLSGVD